MYDTILIRYGEIGLKGDNRGYFENALVRRITNAIKDTGAEVIRSSGRIMIARISDYEDIVIRLSKVFGIVSVSPVRTCAPDMDEILLTSTKVFSEISPRPLTFKVESRRSNKRFPLTSPEISRGVGGHLLQEFSEVKVDVHQPQVVVNVEVRDKEAFVFSSVISGLGGLPVGVSGHGLLLLSGGIDSPVAGWMAMKRGIKLSGIHFHSYPYTGERSRLKVIELAQRLAAYNQGINLHIVNVASIQDTIVRQCPEQFRVTILRRMMLRIAEMVAKNNNIQTLITGESVGQVASQTLESMNVIGDAVRILILKPLCGFDKSEITDLAIRIDTYETSIQPYDDCCSLFLPKHPATKPRLEQVVEAENGVDWLPLLNEAMHSAECLKITS
ncbi:MAG: tRNA uracil 4-sulfurtransferase ThiI [Candidatus Saccharibacteria bacterium]